MLDHLARNTVLLVLAAVLFCSACVPVHPVPQKTQLEIRQTQTRSYENREGQIKRIMKAVIDVLQDDGYIVKNADKDLGFVTASKEVDVAGSWDIALSAMAAGSDGRYSKAQVYEASVNISERGKEVKVRAIFQTKILDNMGGTVSVSQIDSPQFYQDFFSKVDNGIFLERQNL